MARRLPGLPTDIFRRVDDLIRAAGPLLERVEVTLVEVERALVGVENTFADATDTLGEATAVLGRLAETLDGIETKLDNLERLPRIEAQLAEVHALLVSPDIADSARGASSDPAGSATTGGDDGTDGTEPPRADVAAASAGRKQRATPEPAAAADRVRQNGEPC